MSLDKALAFVQWALALVFLAASAQLVVAVLHLINVCIEATK